MSREANDEHITVSLKPEEVGYLQGLLREHVEYYERFVHRLPSKCTLRNRQMYELGVMVFGIVCNDDYAASPIEAPRLK